MSPQLFRLIQARAAEVAGKRFDWPDERPKHSPDEDCKGACGARKCVEKAFRDLGAEP